MTIYVDEPQTWNPKFKNYCHMWSSLIDTDWNAGVEELYQMAESIGLDSKYIQYSEAVSGRFPHFDLSPSKRAKALKLGAQFIHLTDWIKQRPNYKG